MTIPSQEHRHPDTDRLIPVVSIPEHLKPFTFKLERVLTSYFLHAGLDDVVAGLLQVTKGGSDKERSIPIKMPATPRELFCFLRFALQLMGKMLILSSYGFDSFSRSAGQTECLKQGGEFGKDCTEILAALLDCADDHRFPGVEGTVGGGDEERRILANELGNEARGLLHRWAGMPTSWRYMRRLWDAESAKRWQRELVAREGTPERPTSSSSSYTPTPKSNHKAVNTLPPIASRLQSASQPCDHQTTYRAWAVEAILGAMSELTQEYCELTASDRLERAHSASLAGPWTTDHVEGDRLSKSSKGEREAEEQMDLDIRAFIGQGSVQSFHARLPPSHILQQPVKDHIHLMRRVMAENIPKQPHAPPLPLPSTLPPGRGRALRPLSAAPSPALRPSTPSFPLANLSTKHTENLASKGASAHGHIGVLKALRTSRAN
ncbi:hypothetical protein HDV00_006269 [Rhizophlyctis rosea]|nr:hypothetical protein HDV00_006269 [Rhizophlyctis rosea]